jgi:hypothetical protein
MPLQTVKPRTRFGRRVATVQSNQSFNFPAPVAGLNYLNPITQQDPKDAVVLTNLIPRPYGVELRRGWRVHQNTLGGVVNTLMDYTPKEGRDFSKLFAALNNNEIWDVTDAGSPTLAVTVPVQLEPGNFSFTNFSTDGQSYLCIVADRAGYWTYDSINGWVQVTIGAGPGQVTFPSGDTTTLEDLDYVTIWKGRLWFIKNDSTIAYFLPIGQVAGALETFDFGALFPNGGRLEALSTWTMDGGNGIDDRLVVFGSGGDLLIYEGTDPADPALFSLVGRWFYGRPPVGRRFFSEYGGDIAIITTRGLLFLSELLQFAGKFRDFVQAAGKVNQVLARTVSESLNSPYWEIKYLLSEQLIIINTPDTRAISDRQLAFEINSLGFVWLRGMTMRTCNFFKDNLYFGTDSGEVNVAFVGNTDGQTLDGMPGLDIEGEVQTAWVPCGDPSKVKRYIMVEPYFIAPMAPSVKVQINSDWSFQSVPGSPSFAMDDYARWDVVRWDEAKWVGSVNSFKAWTGTNGIGHFSSIRILIRGLPGTIFTNYVIVVESGGIL